MRPIDADSINWESVEEEHGARTPAVVVIFAIGARIIHMADLVSER